MPAADERWRAYACKYESCDWKATWADGLEHVARNHLDEVPYTCLPRGYKAATDRDINRHIKKSSMHQKCVENYTGPVVSYQAEIDVAGHLVKMSLAENQQLWSKRSHARASSAVAKHKRIPSPKARSSRSISSSSPSSSSSTTSSSAGSSSSTCTVTDPAKKAKPSSEKTGNHPKEQGQAVRPSTSDGPYKNPPTKAPVKAATNGDVPKALSKIATTENEAKASAKAPITPKDTPTKPQSKPIKPFLPRPQLSPLKTLLLRSLWRPPPNRHNPPYLMPLAKPQCHQTLPVWLKWPKRHWLPSLMWPLVQLLRTWCPFLTLLWVHHPIRKPSSNRLNQPCQRVHLSPIMTSWARQAVKPRNLLRPCPLPSPWTGTLCTSSYSGQTLRLLLMVARQLIMTTHHLISVTEKLGNSDTKSDRGPDDHTLLVKIESHLAAIDKSLKKQELAREQETKDRRAPTSSIGNLAAAIRASTSAGSTAAEPAATRSPQTGSSFCFRKHSWQGDTKDGRHRRRVVGQNITGKHHLPRDDAPFSP